MVPYEQGTEAFRRLLFELGFRPLHSFAELQEAPSESLFILLGNPNGLTHRYFPEGLHTFVEQGGAVLIATDMPTVGEADQELGRLAGVRVTGETLVLRRRFLAQNSQHFLYNNSEYCPFVEPLEGPDTFGTVTALIGGDIRPDLFRRSPRLDSPRLRVAANAPSRLVISRWWLPVGIHRLAKLSMLCQDEKAGGPHFVDEKGALFAVGGTVGKGRVLVLADHSLFINRMILPQDNNNLEFAAHCLYWLRGGISTPGEVLRAVRSHAEQGNANIRLAGQRIRVLLWDDGVIRSDFQAPLKRMPASPLPSEPAIVAALDQTIAQLEQKNAWNRALLERIDELPGGRKGVVRQAVYLLTLAVLVFLGQRFLWRTRHRPELAVPSLTEALRKHEPQRTLLEQRRRALVHLGNVWEIGRRLAREYFASAGVALTGAAPPRVVTAPGRRWQRWRLNRRVARLWRLARGDAPAHLSPAALKRRLRDVEELQTAWANGTIEEVLSEG
jgi:hypothetical protein